MPPLMVSEPTPSPFTPPAAIVPALSVRPPGNRSPFMLRMPVPVLMKPVPTAVDRACPWKLRVLPVATLMVATVPPVLRVPPGVTVTFSFATIPEKVVVAPVMVSVVPPFASKMTFDPEVHAVV